MAASADFHAAKSLVENLLNELRLLAADAKRYGHIKEACERAMTKLHGVTINFVASKVQNHKVLLGVSLEVCQPILLAVKSKQPKLVQTALSSLQRLVSHQIFDASMAESLVDDLWHLVEAEIEELRVLQTMSLLGNSPHYITGHILAKSLVICFRMNFAKDPFVINTASATVRQLVAQVFERCKQQNGVVPNHVTSEASTVQKLTMKNALNQLSTAEADAYMLFQDLCRLINAEPPLWLVGITEMTRTLGLDLLDTILSQNVDTFSQKAEFVFVLKEHVCPLVIKLFSPNLKFGHKPSINNLLSSATNFDPSGGRSPEKPYFPIVLRLNRLVLTLITRYHKVLSTECEIFLSLLLKFLDQDKIDWYRALAVETVYKIVKKKELLSYFCDTYDSKPYSAKIVRDLVSCVQNFLCLSFMNRSSEHTNLAEICESLDEQSAFFVDNSYVPFLNLFTDCSTKILYSDMLEKIEPPEPSRGYFVSAAFLCVSQISCSIVSIVDSDQSASCENKTLQEDSRRAVNEQLLLSTSGHLLTCYNTLLDNCLDERLIEDLLKNVCQIFRLICRFSSLQTIRRSFVSFLCSCSLPANYFSSVLQRDISKLADGKKLEDFDESRVHQKSKLQKVYAITSPCPVAGMALNVLNTRVTVTVKNLFVARYLLEASIFNAEFLDDCWTELLTTLQHLCCVLGFKPSPTTGLLEPPKASTDPMTRHPSSLSTLSLASTTTTSCTISSSHSNISALNYVAQIAFNCSALFRKTVELNATSLNVIVEVLCLLSDEACRICAELREPSYFSICKFVEITSVNLFRSDEFIKRILDQLIKLCAQPYFQLRECSTAAMVSIVSLALVESEKCSLNTSALLINALLCLNRENQYIEVVQQQLSCVLQILHSKGQILNPGLWSSVVESVGNVSGSNAKELVIRQAFQAVQLISSDCLAGLPISSFQVLLGVVLKFGCQCVDTNISLSAIGLLWNINDYLFLTVRRESKIELWMQLYCTLAELCVDHRPAVRKSSCETLFGALHAHSTDIPPSLSYSLISQILLPLLQRIEENLKISCVQPPSPGNDTKSSTEEAALLIHHSRDTKGKQWAETATSALGGVCKFFQAKYTAVAQTVENHPKLELWYNLLGNIRNMANSTNDEVSVEALKCFFDLVSNFKSLLAADRIACSPDRARNPPLSSSFNPVECFTEDQTIKLYAWLIWADIGKTSKNVILRRSPESNFFTLSLKLFAMLFDSIKSFVDFQRIPQCFDVLKTLASAHLAYCQKNASKSKMPFSYASSNSGDLMPMQRLILDCLKLLAQEFCLVDSKLKRLAADYAVFCLGLSNTCWESSMNIDINMQPRKCGEMLKSTYDRLAQLILRNTADFYKMVATCDVIVKGGVVTKLLEALLGCLSDQKNIASSGTYYSKQCVQSLAEIVELAVPDCASKFISHEGRERFYLKLAECVEAYLSSRKFDENLSFEEQNYRRYLDGKLIDALKNAVLPNVKFLPAQFSKKIVSLLHKASLHNYSLGPSDYIPSLHKVSNNGMRVDLPLLCLNALSEVSKKNVDLLTSPPIGQESEIYNSVVQAADACLSTCKQIIASFVHELRSNLNAPIPRQRVEELEKVLNAIDTLIDSLKLSNQSEDAAKFGADPKAARSFSNFADKKYSTPALCDFDTPEEKSTLRNRQILTKLFTIYPLLVDLIECNNRQIRNALIKTLKNFAVFLT